MLWPYHDVYHNNMQIDSINIIILKNILLMYKKNVPLRDRNYRRLVHTVLAGAITQRRFEQIQNQIQKVTNTESHRRQSIRRCTDSKANGSPSVSRRIFLICYKLERENRIAIGNKCRFFTRTGERDSERISFNFLGRNVT